MNKTDNEPLKRIMDHIAGMLEGAGRPMPRAIVIAETARALRMTVETVRRQVRQLAAAGEAVPFVEAEVAGKRYLALRAHLDAADARVSCGKCAKRITPGVEYWRDDGNPYHNNCIPLATTGPLNPAQTAQTAPQQARTLVAGVGVQLGAGRPQNG